MSSASNPTSLDPSALSLENAAKLLTKLSGFSVRVDMLQKDIEAGAPTNPDGTLNLVQYCAWLVGEMGNGN